MSHDNLDWSLKKLPVLLVALVAPAAFAENPAEGVLEPTASNQASAIWNTPVPVGPGRYRLTGTALDGSGRPTCALALASGRCMFTCGPGSGRCEGGSANLPFGQFDLTDLATESNGTIRLQIFVEGLISATKTISTIGPPPAPPPANARWTAVNLTCCSDNSPITLAVTVAGITRTSVNRGCSVDPTVQDFASTSAGNKSFTATESGCGDTVRWDGTVTMANNACYVFVSTYESGKDLLGFEPIDCSFAASADSLREVNQATPMAIFPSSSDRANASKLRRLQPR
jgi:hypothetical protein